MTTKLTFVKYRQMRWYSTKEKMRVVDTVNEQLTNEELKHRHHPGKLRLSYVQQPSWLLDTILDLLKDGKISHKSVWESGKKLGSYLHERHIPFESVDISIKLNEVRSRTKMYTETKEDLLKNPKALKLFKQLVYNWQPVEYDKYTSLSYLVNRSVPEYSVLCRIMNEINSNDTNFTPKTLFDFGSGIGTVMWAASQFWLKSIYEYYCIDTSGHMNNLSEYLTKKAKPQIPFKNIFYRQFLPASPTPTYDIVVSAYSLFELPDQKSRLEVIAKLWEKTENYLIIVEQGTRAGFTIINEARDFILNYTKQTSGAHVFSPCPHDLACPRYTNDNTPCNFEVSYQTLRIATSSKYLKERYSYVVLKKGERSEDDYQWPRIVRPTMKRSKHVICRLCTSSGKLEEQIFTTWKNGKNTYRCSRASKWGDCLPFKTEEKSNEEPK
ncbi:methyltransferase-like protein 17, mitochondrial [Hylaeus anthracinus]|uniref:methyltransferase-like protein 17, mitochondrial n=1 Tax=Hylaeus anthracinus TaxID=313031 RepID=UPI0023B8A58A|nr:methyltransferase-like protein 17, mitochondrial [Hylaeus anthracinus]XP_054012170.1 methyltransferase-like protein 17, mitochondrial [Hylaeus anthracinus]